MIHSVFKKTEIHDFLFHSRAGMHFSWDAKDWTKITLKGLAFIGIMRTFEKNGEYTSWYFGHSLSLEWSEEYSPLRNFANFKAILSPIYVDKKGLYMQLVNRFRQKDVFFYTQFFPERDVFSWMSDFLQNNSSGVAIHAFLRKRVTELVRNIWFSVNDIVFVGKILQKCWLNYEMPTVVSKPCLTFCHQFLRKSLHRLIKL